MSADTTNPFYNDKYPILPIMKKPLCLAVSLLLTVTAVHAADLAESVSALIPGLASDTVEDRYGYQMQLQDLASHASRPGAEKERAALSALLAERVADADIPTPARGWMVRQLEYMGGKEAVDALAGLLNDDDAVLREDARRALEKNPSREASEALRDALETATEPAWQVGLINALGERGDTRAVSAISPLMENEATAAAACTALAKINSRTALKQLDQAYESGLAAAGSALVLAAEVLTADGNERKARDILEPLLEEGQTAAMRAAAFAGLIDADPRAAKDRVKQGLTGELTELQNAAMRAVASDLETFLPVLTESLTDCAESVQIQAMDLVDRSAESVVQKLVESDVPEVREAALTALGRVGSVESVSELLDVVAAGGGAAAEQALARISGDGVSEAIREAARDMELPERVAAIKALAARYDLEALPELLALAREKNEDVAKAALAAIREIGNDEAVQELAKMVLEDGPAQAMAALKSVAARADDKIAATRELIEMSEDAVGEQKAKLLEVLGVLGSEEGLNEVVKQAESSLDAVQDGAIRALGNWQRFDAVDPLLAMAANPNLPDKYKILSLRGVARLVSTSPDADPAARIAAVTTAMEAADRDDEKRLLLAAATSVHHPDAAAVITPMLIEGGLRQEAGLAGIELAKQLRRGNRDAARALAQAVADAEISDELTQAADEVLRR